MVHLEKRQYLALSSLEDQKTAYEFDLKENVNLPGSYYEKPATGKEATDADDYECPSEIIDEASAVSHPTSAPSRLNMNLDTAFSATGLHPLERCSKNPKLGRDDAFARDHPKSDSLLSHSLDWYEAIRTEHHRNCHVKKPKEWIGNSKDAECLAAHDQ
ncbi:hypothetical protein MMC28_004120 [Mycoblastus sanguinarius]|nr:hypothetical protein [Mycoblastus sanguinarius]